MDSIAGSGWLRRHRSGSDVLKTSAFIVFVTTRTVGLHPQRSCASCRRKKGKRSIRGGAACCDREQVGAASKRSRSNWYVPHSWNGSGPFERPSTGRGASEMRSSRSSLLATSRTVREREEFKRHVCNSFASRALATLCIVATLALAGCQDSIDATVRDVTLEKGVRDFYLSADKELAVARLSSGKEIHAYCVLEPYEDRLTDRDNAIVSANSFLEAIGLLPEEDYWHVVVEANGSFRLLRLRQQETPLLTPKVKHMGRDSCAAGKALVLRKASGSDSVQRALIIGD